MTSKKTVYQSELEDVLNLRRATVSGILMTMEKNGIIKRVASKKDARTKEIILNEKVEKIFFMSSIRNENVRECINFWNKQDRP